MTSIALIAHNGRYVQAGSGDGDGGDKVRAVGRSRGPAQTFVLVDAGNGRVRFQARSGRYVRVRRDGALVADAATPGAAEAFRLSTRNDGAVTVQAGSGRYVSAGRRGVETLVADRSQAGDWEMFRAEYPDRQGDGDGEGAVAVVRPVVMVAPVSGRQGQPVHLPIAVVNPSPGALTLDDALEISGVPAGFDVVPGQAGREHAPGFHQWSVPLAGLADVQLVPRGDPTGSFAVGVVASGRDRRGELRTALQFLDVTVVPDAANLRVVMDPLPAMTVIDSPGGYAQIALQASNGQFVCAEGGGGGAVNANRGVRDTWETFGLVDLGAGSVALRASNGQFVCAEGGGGGAVHANRGVRGPWETFHLVDLGAGTVALQTSTGNHLSARNGGGGEVNATAGTPGPWETFRLTTLSPLEHRFFHRPLGTRKAIVFQVSGARDAQLGFFAGAGGGAPAYEVALGGQDDEHVALRRGTERASAPAPDVLNPNSAVGSTWTAVSGALSMVAANALGDVWGVLPEGGAVVRSGGAWQPVDGAFRQVTVGLDTVWGLAWDGSVSVRTGVTRSTPAGAQWSTTPGDALRVHQISAGLHGQLWGSGASGQVVVRTGISDATPAGTGWQPVEGPGMTTVSCCGLSVWATREDDTVWFRTGMSPQAPTGTGWQQVPGTLRQVSVTATGRVWALDPSGQLHVRAGVTAADLSGTGWQAVGDGPQLRQVACTAAGGWGVDPANKVWVRRGAEAPTFWADARDGLVRLGRGAVVDEDVVLQWQDAEPLDVDHVGVRTQGGTGAHWSLTLPGAVPLGARIIDQTRTPGSPLQVLSSAGDQPGAGYLTVGDSRYPPSPGPGHTLAVLDRATLVRRSQTTYDTASRADERARLAGDLNGLGEDSIVCIWSSGGVGSDPVLADALRRCGAAAGVRSLGVGQWSYALVGVPGRGEGAGFEDVHPAAEHRAAELRLLWHDGVLERDEGVAWTSSAPLRGSWEPSHVVLSGLPADASLSAGQRVATAADGTTMWAVPAPEVAELAVTLPTGIPLPDEQGHGTTRQATFSAETSATLTLGAADVEASASVSSQNLAGFGSDGLNAWIGAETENTAEAKVGAEFPGGHTIALTAAASASAGAGGAGGVGAQTTFPCPVCDGSGQVPGPGNGTTQCPRCAGQGVLEAPGARLHLYAGAVLQASVSVSVGVQIAHDVTASGTVDSTAEVGAQAVGDLEVYAGSGRYGGKAGGDTFVGAGVKASIDGRFGAYGSSVSGGGGVTSSGILGVGGGGTAVWDGGRLTVGAKGALGVLLFGVDLDLEITVDTGPLQSVVVTGWDRYGTVALTTLVNGGPDAIAWAKDAGAVLAVGADDVIQLGAGAAYLGDVLQNDVGGPLTTFGVGAGDFVLDVGGSIGTTFSAAGATVGTALTDTGITVGNAIAGAGITVGNTLADAGSIAVNTVGNAFEDFGHSLGSLFGS